MVEGSCAASGEEGGSAATAALHMRRTCDQEQHSRADAVQTTVGWRLGDSLTRLSIDRDVTNKQKWGAPAAEPYKKVICDNLNLLVGTQSLKKAAHDYWTTVVKKELRQQFRVRHPALKKQRHASSTDLY